jgi:hypothetical protein
MASIRAAFISCAKLQSRSCLRDFTSALRAGREYRVYSAASECQFFGFMSSFRDINLWEAAAE